MKITMFKPTLLLSSVITLAFGLAGCGGNGEDPTPSSSSEVSISSKSSTSTWTTSSSKSSVATSSRSSSSAPSVQGLGYTALPNGFGGVNYEPVDLTQIGSNFDKEKSLEIFKGTLYKFLRDSGCAGCHNSKKAEEWGGGQAPLHSDDDPALAHDYALTRMNFKDPANSKFVVRMKIDRHHCPDTTCAASATKMLKAVEDWKAGVASMLPTAPKPAVATEADVKKWIADDKAKLPEADKKYIMYTSLHELVDPSKTGGGLTGEQLDIVRVALSKALNSNARWAPKLVHPVDVNGQGVLYKFDVRDYWGWNQGVKELFFGGSDDDLAFGNGKKDYKGTAVTASVQNKKYSFTGTTVKDPEHALRVWERVLHGNVEGAVSSGTIKPYIDGFKGTRKNNAAGDYVDINAFEWVEAAQLVYTLTRPDVYNSINALPFYADELERNVQIDHDKGMDSYKYVAQLDAITIDSRLLFRANRKSGKTDFYWKSFDIFTGQLPNANGVTIKDVYDPKTEGKHIRFPWWANPIPKFVQWLGQADDTTNYSHIASLNQAVTSGGSSGQFISASTAGCDPVDSYAGSTFKNCLHYTGKGGFNQAAAEVIYNMANGLNGYYLTGGTNQRRVDAFNLIVRDPRILTSANDGIAYELQYKTGYNVNDPRLNTGSSCIGCHADGMNRMNNDMRLWLDKAPERLPRGKTYGAEKWLGNAATEKRIRELYPTNQDLRVQLEADRQHHLTAMADIKDAMIKGEDKNVHVEPIIWTVEHVQRVKYKYAQTTSN